MSEILGASLEIFISCHETRKDNHLKLKAIGIYATALVTLVYDLHGKQSLFS